MTDFVCRHCGSPVRIPGTGAGKEVRCPSCRRALTVPPPPPHSDASPPAGAGDAGDDAPVPPPPQLYEPSLEDLELDSASKDPFSETDIIPIDQVLGAEPGDSKAARAARKRAVAVPRRPDATKRVATFTAIAIMLLLIAVVYAFLILRSL